jgi:cytoskeletal protein CcmA (bactofilin family)
MGADAVEDATELDAALDGAVEEALDGEARLDVPGLLAVLDVASWVDVGRALEVLGALDADEADGVDVDAAPVCVVLVDAVGVPLLVPASAEWAVSPPHDCRMARVAAIVRSAPRAAIGWSVLSRRTRRLRGALPPPPRTPTPVLDPARPEPRAPTPSRDRARDRRPRVPHRAHRAARTHTPNTGTENGNGNADRKEPRASFPIPIPVLYSRVFRGMPRRLRQRRGARHTTQTPPRDIAPRPVLPSRPLMAQPRSASSRSSTPAVLGAGTRVRGRLTGDGEVTVLGHVEGEVHLRGALFVGEGGEVAADVDADALRVAGTVTGDVNVSGDVTILSGAKVRGDVRGGSIVLHEGGELDGRIDCEFTLPSELGKD